MILSCLIQYRMLRCASARRSKSSDPDQSLLGHADVTSDLGCLAACLTASDIPQPKGSRV